MKVLTDDPPFLCFGLSKCAGLSGGTRGYSLSRTFVRVTRARLFGVEIVPTIRGDAIVPICITSKRNVSVTSKTGTGQTSVLGTDGKCVIELKHTRLCFATPLQSRLQRRWTDASFRVSPTN